MNDEKLQELNRRLNRALMKIETRESFEQAEQKLESIINRFDAWKQRFESPMD